MAYTGGSGRVFPGFEDVAKDIVPDSDAARVLGAVSKRWKELYAVMAILTALTIGGIYLGATAGGDLYINASTIVNGSLTAVDNVSADYFVGSGSYLTGIQQGTLILFFLNETIDGENRTLSAIPNETEVTISGSNLPDGNNLLGEWVTKLNVPGMAYFPPGNWLVHVEGKKTGGSKDVRFFYEIYKVNSTGGDEVLISTSSYSNYLTSDRGVYNIYTYMSDTTLNATDRIKVKGYAYVSGGGSAPSVEAYIQGNSNTRIELPAPILATENFVPYTNPAKNLNFSTFNISALYFFGDGSQLTNLPSVGDNASWNESYARTLFADIKWGYNMSDGSFNATYDTWAYNQSDGSYNATYDMWAYNQSDGSYNATYDKWAYNQSDGGMDYTNVAMVNQSNTFTGINQFSNNQLLIAQNLMHYGDNDTYIKFENDYINFYAGSWSFIRFFKSITNDVIINNDLNGINFMIHGSSVPEVFKVDASADKVIMKKTDITENLTLSDELIISQDKNLYMGSGKQYFNGTCLILEGSASTLEVC